MNNQANPPAWLILDASAINHLDISAVVTLNEVRAALAERGIAFGIAELHSRPRAMIERSGLGARMARHDFRIERSRSRCIRETYARRSGNGIVNGTCRERASFGGIMSPVVV